MADVATQDKPWLWKPGQSGNPSGRPKKSFSFTPAFKRKLNEYARADDGSYIHLYGKRVKWGDLLVHRIITQAIQDVDPALVRIPIAYVDGNPKQDVDIKAETTSRSLTVIAGAAKDYVDRISGQLGVAVDSGVEDPGATSASKRARKPKPKPAKRAS